MNPRKVFHDSVLTLPDQPGMTATGLKVNSQSPDSGQEKMQVSFSLALPAEKDAELEDIVAGGRTVPASELASTYAVAAAEVDPLVDWLKKEGFTVDHVSADRTGVFASAPVATIERSLAVDMVRITKGGITYTAARNAPSLPADIAASVHAIGGLQPFRHAHKHFRRMNTPTSRRLPARGSVDPAQKPELANAPPYLVSEVLKAYGANGLGVTGREQVIAILIDTVPSDADLQAFWQRNGLASELSRVTMINVNDTALPAAEGEETLDAQWTSGIAPDAQIRIYASGSLQFVDLDRALQRLIDDLPSFPGMRQLSISLGLGETYMQRGEVRTQHAKYLRLAAAGVNVFVSTGDAGSNPDDGGQSSTGPLQVEYGASDPAVVGVGGTSLRLASQGEVLDESGWPDSGGGRSMLFARPRWQVAKGVVAGSGRLVPDVSLVADPGTGALVILNGKDLQIGGTSWSAPVWAGFCALINEARLSAGKPALPFLNPLLYPLGSTDAFRDIQTGSNGAYQASPGYDMVTGLGVPDVRALMQGLLALP